MSLRRRRLAAIAMVATAPFALSACGTSFGAQTNQQYQPGIGANLRDTDKSLQVYGALFVDNGDGTATFSGALLARGEDDLTLESVQVAPSQGASVEATLSGPIELPAESLVPVGEKGEIIVESEDVRAGYYTTVTFMAGSGEQVSLNVPVVERDHRYADVARTPSPEPAATEGTDETGLG